MKYPILILFIVLTIFCGKAQDTIRLKKQPTVKLHGWYPNFKFINNLKIGETTIVMTLTPDFDSTKLRNCIIKLTSNNKDIEVKETGKIYPSQFLITVNPTKEKYAQFDAWLVLENETVLIYQNNRWMNIKELYHVDGNKVKIDTIQLKLKK